MSFVLSILHIRKYNHVNTNTNKILTLRDNEAGDSGRKRKIKRPHTQRAYPHKHTHTHTTRTYYTHYTQHTHITERERERERERGGLLSSVLTAGPTATGTTSSGGWLTVRRPAAGHPCSAGRYLTPRVCCGSANSGASASRWRASAAASGAAASCWRLMRVVLQARCHAAS